MQKKSGIDTMYFDSNLLSVYYHPVIFDLAISFSKLFKSVDICVVNDLKDNYGTTASVINKAKSLGLTCLPFNQAILKIKTKHYSLVGLDGVFQGDSFIMDLCDSMLVRYFNISGYPHTVDERSKNILSFSWYMPQMQYRSKYPAEGYVKELNWAKIANFGYDHDQKNIFVFYPEFSKLKQTRINFLIKVDRLHFISAIHRFAECNQNSYKVFEQIRDRILPIPFLNASSLSQENLYSIIANSYGMIHLKHADCPGISLIESMLLGRVPFVLKDFVLASNNQEVLIDNHSAKVCSTVEELIDRSIEHKKELDKILNGFSSIEVSTMKHADMLTNFNRQKQGLINFFNRCLNGN
jgi:hypothetical protein